MHAIIQWKVAPQHLEEELRLLADVHRELDEKKPDDIAYATYRVEEGASFVAVVHMPKGLGVLQGLHAFGRYRGTLEARCEENPVVTVLDCVGAYVSPGMENRF